MYTQPTGWGIGWGIAEIVLRVAFLAGIIWVAIVLVRGMRGKEKKPGESAMEILKERYAKGEITKKEFEEMKKDIA